ncbi:MAG: pilus assembly protein PilM [Coxiellaceae bacterium]|nr:MAG: pilus assembly protein PilM [Coxiellaceae bacterium]
MLNFNWIKQYWLAKPVLGIEIHHTAVHVVELTNRPKQGHIRQQCSVALPAELQNEAQLLAVAPVAALLKQALVTANIKTTRVVTCVPMAAVMFKTLTLPARFTHTAIKQHLKTSAERYFSQPLTDIFYDFTVLPSVNVMTEKQIRLIAARRSLVQNRVDILRAAGLHVTAVDVDALALARVVMQLSAKNHCWVIITAEKILCLEIVNHAINHVYEERYDNTNAEEALLSLLWRQLPRTMTTEVSFERLSLLGELINIALMEKLQAVVSVPIEIIPFPLILPNKQRLAEFNQLISYGLAIW